MARLDQGSAKDIESVITTIRHALEKAESWSCDFTNGIDIDVPKTVTTGYVNRKLTAGKTIHIEINGGSHEQTLEEVGLSIGGVQCRQ